MKLFPIFMVLAAFALSACSTTSPGYKGVYAGAQTTDPLQVPPDLSQPEYVGDSSEAVTSYLGYKQSLNAQDKDTMLNTYKDMRFVRDGSLFWLDINDSAIHVWQSLRAFFAQLGFKIIYEKPDLGLMQTNWRENQASLPHNWFLKHIGKLFSSETLDSYRAHLEYDDAKKITRVFIVHQGVKEDGEADTNGTFGTQWVRRPADPELEVEMLMRFMTFRGMGEKQAKQEIAQTKVVEKALLNQTAEGYVLQYNDAFPRAWRLVGIALDRMGVQVEDRNYSAGVFYIQLSDSFKLDGKSGFFDSAGKPSKLKYLLTLEDKGDKTLIRVKPRGEVGADLPAVTKQILSEIKSNLL